MDCAEFQAALLADVSSPQLETHLAQCPRCAFSLAALECDLARLHGREPSLDAVEHEHMLGAVRSAIARERGLCARLRSLSTRARLLLATGSALLMIVVIAVWHGRSDLALYPAARLALITLLYGAALVAILRQALWPLSRARPTPRADRVALGLAIAAPFAIGALPPAAFVFDASATGEGRDCWPVGLLLAGLFVALLRALDRRDSNAQRGTLLAIAAATLLANLGLLFHCPISHPAHLVSVHATLGLLLLTGRWLGNRLARPHRFAD